MIWTSEELESIRIGYGIHLRVIDYGRKETSMRNDGSRVMAYLDHDLIGSGKCPFVKWDSRTKVVSRNFSRDLADEIRSHVNDLKVYFRYVRFHNPPG